MLQYKAQIMSTQNRKKDSSCKLKKWEPHCQSTLNDIPAVHHVMTKRVCTTYLVGNHLLGGMSLMLARVGN